MEEYHQVKQEINHKKPNTGLIVALVIVVILAIGGVIGTWYYMNNKAKNAKKAQDEQIQQLQKQIDDLKKQAETKTNETKTISYATKYELLKFAYENGWTISDTSTPKVANSTTNSGRDTIKLTSPNGFVITIDAGLYGIGGACDTCSVLYSEPVTVLGNQYFLNFVQNTETGKGVSSIILAQKADEIFSGFNAKNIKAINGEPSLIIINAKYANGNTVVVKDLNTLKSDPNVQVFKSFLQSLSY